MDARKGIEASENNETTNLDTSLDITDEEKKNAIQFNGLYHNIEAILGKPIRTLKKFHPSIGTQTKKLRKKP